LAFANSLQNNSTRFDQSDRVVGGWQYDGNRPVYGHRDNALDQEFRRSDVARFGIGHNRGDNFVSPRAQ
jgi:hypothetical protein